MLLATHSLNWHAGWGLILSAFVTGAGLGLFFDRDGFLGGYGSFRRRLFRLGHVAQAALGMLNVLYGLSPAHASPTWLDQAAALGFLIGGISMPFVCFLSGWRPGFRGLFVVPVAALLLAVLCTLRGGLP
jgi:hypothetical protein